jgi:hypothetical protein
MGEGRMSEGIGPVAANYTKPCKVCGETIKLAAHKCIHCDSYQDWRANISFGNTFLALLVALISVTTTAVPVIRYAFTPDNSELLFSFQDSTEDSINVLISNTGSRPGSIGNEPYLSIPTNLAMVALTFSDGKSFLLDSGKSTLLQLTYTPKNTLTATTPFSSMDILKLPDNVACTIALSATDFQARFGAIPLQPACKRLKPFLSKVARSMNSVPSAQ